MPGSGRWLVEHAWLGGDALERDVLIEVTDGHFTTIEPGARDSTAVPLAGVALPGLVNAHSHAFHRLLRGRTHQQGGDFWAWRDLMYEVASELTPDNYELIATAVFTEMAMAGITAVGEFHYVHHQPGGDRYPNPNEMGEALIRAARRAGIRIALLDACYLASGFGDEPLHDVQRRFSDGNVDAWLDRVERLADGHESDGDVRIGLAPHSVRAVPAEGLGRVAERVEPGTKVHIHVSEQQAENEACLEATGLTPVGLLDRVGLLSVDTTAVHGTNLVPADIELLGDAGTGVCYCATTERDLADGMGPGAALVSAGSPLSAGTDSHAVIDMFEEARGIELHERLRSGRRGVFSPRDLLEAITVNGSVAIGFDAGRLAEGHPADFVAIRADSTRTRGTGGGLAGVAYSASSADVVDVFVAGTHIVSGGHHPGWETAGASLVGAP